MREPLVTPGAVLVSVLVLAGAVTIRAVVPPPVRDVPFVDHSSRVAPEKPAELVSPIPGIPPYVGEAESRVLRDRLRHAELARSLTRCCGAERGTFGPLFGDLAIGALGGDPVPDRNELEQLKPTFFTGLGQYAMYLDGVQFEVPDEDLCEQLEKRLRTMWGSTQPWIDHARRQAARFSWTSSRVCTLGFFRATTQDAAHCLRDEVPAQRQDVDVERGCLEPQHTVGCMLDRDLGGPGFPVCCADDRSHTYYWTDKLGCAGRRCTSEEWDRLDLHLGDCDPSGHPKS